MSDFKDLGMTISLPFSFDEHILNIVLRANRMLGLLSKSFKARTPSILLPIYKAHVRSILEYGNVIWSPYQKEFINNIEKVQRRFTRMFPDIRHLDYRNRLSRLHLLSLSAGRLRYKLIFLFKVVNNFVNVNPYEHFTFSSRSQRGNPLKILMPSCVHRYRSNFFTIDVISHWNNLTFDEAAVTTIPQFKTSIASYFSRMEQW